MSTRSRARRAIGGTVAALIFASCTAAAPTVPPSMTAEPSAAEPSAAESSAAESSAASPSVRTPEFEGRLLFSTLDEASHTFGGMFTMAPDGSDERPVPLPGPEGGGRWSTSGKEIAVMTILSDDRVGTAILDPLGTVLRVLDIPDPTLNMVCTVWSPDDTRLSCEAWDETDPARGGLYSVDAGDGGGLLRLTAPPDGLSDLPGDIGPHGGLLFKRATEYDQPGDLLVVDADGGEPLPRTDVVATEPGRVSPDGKSVAVGIECIIVILDTDGAESHRIEESGRCVFGPAWSPDGAWIAYSSAADGPFADIVVSRPDGTERTATSTTPENEIGLDWGP